MRHGTFSCWVWGHKFLVEKEEYQDLNMKFYRLITKLDVVDFCVRCGICKEPAIIIGEGKK